MDQVGNIIINDIITNSYMAHEPTSTVRARRLRERRARGVIMVAPVEVGEGGVELLVGNGLLKQHQAGDRKAVGEACLAALEQWAGGRGVRTVGRRTGIAVRGPRTTGLRSEAQGPEQQYRVLDIRWMERSYKLG